MKYAVVIFAIGMLGCSQPKSETAEPTSTGTMGSGAANSLADLYYPMSVDTAQSSTQKDASGNTATVSVRESSDTPEKIREFFDSKLGKAKNEVGMDTGFTANWEKGNSRYMVSVTRLGERSTIVVTVSEK